MASRSSASESLETLEALEALARRGWRLAVGIAALLYLLGSHWPHLEMDPVGTGDVTGPSPDKILHFIAFLLLTLPAWWTGWFRGLGVLWLAGIGFAIFDEVTQGLLPIERDLTLEDLVCDACGVTAAVAILAASRPMPDPTSRRLAAGRRLAEATLLANASNWMVLAATAALGVVVLVPIAVLLSGPLMIEARAMAVAGAAIGAAIAGLTALEFGVGTTWRRLRDSAACLRCGTVDEAAAACSGCGGIRRSHDWLLPAGPSAWNRFEASWWPLLRAGLAAGVVLVGLEAIEQGWRRSPDHSTVARVVDLTVIVVAGASAVLGTRRRLSEILRASGRICVRCGHDLRGLRTAAAGVRCPECGSSGPPAEPQGGGGDSTSDADGETMPR